jgi:hypothetical protein
MLEIVVGIVEHGDGEVGRIAKGSTGGEAARGRRMDRRSGRKAVEAAKIKRSVRL